MKLVMPFIGTRGAHYSFPDVAHGFTSLLIALVNIPFWTDMARVPAPSDTIDTTWLWVHSLLINPCTYPLFVVLLGFRLVTMVNRRIVSGAASYPSFLPDVEGDRGPTSRKATWVREQTTVDARRLMRRRGPWMILFGAMYAVLLSDDIIGPYDLVAVVFAGWIIHKHWKQALAFCAVVVIADTTTLLNMGSFPASQGASAMSVYQGAGALTDTVLSYVFGGLLVWDGSLASVLLFSMIVPAMFLGARLADTGLIAHPKHHRRLLVAAGLGGLRSGIAGGTGFTTQATGGPLIAWTMPLHVVMSVTGTCGWLALLTLYAGGSRPDDRLMGPCRLAFSVGRRSTTAHLGQTFLFTIIFVVLPTLIGIELHLGEARVAGIALAVRLVTVGLCAAPERDGHAGPFETLLCVVVAHSGRWRRLPAPPAPATPASSVGTSSTCDLVR